MKIEIIMLLIFVGAIALMLAFGLRSGRMLYGRGFNFRLLYVERSKHPALFWLLTAFYVAMIVMVGSMVWR
jgi:hypothetical protein